MSTYFVTNNTIVFASMNYTETVLEEFVRGRVIVSKFFAVDKRRRRDRSRGGRTGAVLRGRGSRSAELRPERGG